MNGGAKVIDQAFGDGWASYLGDCVQVIDGVPDESVGLILYSPPFPGMYAYSNSPNDMGNTRNTAEMMNQYRFLVRSDKLMRVLMPGRTCAVHLSQEPAQLGKDDYVGMKDFRGDVIRLMEEEGWIYYGEVCIDKNPQVKANRTKDASLQFKSLANDSSRMRMALADYLVIFHKPGKNPRPIRAGISTKYDNPHGWITNDEWIRWARPVWYGADFDPQDGIRETDVLNAKCAKETEEERHLCPLQLGVIERAVKLWSAPGEIVASPFAGIASEGHGAVRLGRRFVGIELKRSYWAQGIKNLRRAEQLRDSMQLNFGASDADAVAAGPSNFASPSEPVAVAPDDGDVDWL
jgi:DNA modification methylase